MSANTTIAFNNILDSGRIKTLFMILKHSWKEPRDEVVCSNKLESIIV